MKNQSLFTITETRILFQKTAGVLGEKLLEGPKKKNKF